MASTERPPAIFVMGPTASGKTDLAIALQQHLPVELINVDSAQIYRQLDIGSAKPDKATLAAAPHRLIDILDPWKPILQQILLLTPLGRWRRSAVEEKSHCWWAAPCSILRRCLRGCRICLQPMPTFVPRYSSRRRDLAGPQCMNNCAPWTPRAPPVCIPIIPRRIQRALEVYRISGVPCRPCAGTK